MSKEDYMTQARKEEVRDHLQREVQNAFKEARNELKETKEFQQFMEDFLSTKTCEERLSRTDKKGYLEAATTILNTASEDTDSWRIVSAIRDIAAVYNIPWINFESDEDGYDIEDIAENLSNIVEECITKNLIELQEYYAFNKLKVKTYPDYRDWEKFNAVLACTENGSLEEITNRVLNALDIEEMIYNKD